MRLRLLTLIFAVTTLLLGAGCSELDNPAAPHFSGQDQTAPTLQTLDLIDDTWTVVATKLVLPGLVSQVQGSRYTLTFQALSLLNPLLVTIRERDAGIVDVELGPDGSVFNKSVTLQIDYRGTVYDPSQPTYAGHRPKLFWFNPERKSWDLVPGTDDAKGCIYTAELQHFSRYAMGDGTSGWEDAPGDRGGDKVN